MNFEPFPKIARLKRDCTITEKIDGTNAQIFITDELLGEHLNGIPFTLVQTELAPFRWIAAGSRNRWITPDNDNYGFAKWVHDNAEELCKLGPGRHFGEWWGAGIQRRYGLNEKRFSLFNTARWTNAEDRPACCHVVPVLYQGDFDTVKIQATLTFLGACGSSAAPGFPDPEGIVIYHAASRQLFKQTIKNDEQPKTFVPQDLNKRFDSATERSNTTL